MNFHGPLFCHHHNSFRGCIRIGDEDKKVGFLDLFNNRSLKALKGALLLNLKGVDAGLMISISLYPLPHCSHCRFPGSWISERRLEGEPCRLGRLSMPSQHKAYCERKQWVTLPVRYD